MDRVDDEQNEKSLIEKLKPRKASGHNHSGVLVKGESGLLVRLSKCCSPVPGDPIIGFVTRGRGVSVHRADCPNVRLDEDVDRLIDVEWDYGMSESFEVNMEISAYDRTA